jgi:hypothetical protein
VLPASTAVSHTEPFELGGWVVLHEISGSRCAPAKTCTPPLLLLLLLLLLVHSMGADAALLPGSCCQGLPGKPTSVSASAAAAAAAGVNSWSGLRASSWLPLLLLVVVFASEIVVLGGLKAGASGFKLEGRSTACGRLMLLLLLPSRLRPLLVCPLLLECWSLDSCLASVAAAAAAADSDAGAAPDLTS